MTMICNWFSPDTAFTCDTIMYDLVPSIALQSATLVPYAFRNKDSTVPTLLPEALLQPVLAYQMQSLSDRTTPATNTDDLKPSITDMAQETGTSSLDGSVELALTFQELGRGIIDSSKAHSSFLIYSSLRKADSPQWIKWAVAPAIPVLQAAANPLLFDKPIDWKETGHAAVISLGTLGQENYSESALTDASDLLLNSAATLSWHHRSESLWAQRQIATSNDPRNFAMVSLGSMFVPATIGSALATEAYVQSDDKNEKKMLLATAAALTCGSLYANRDEGPLALSSVPAGLLTGYGLNKLYHLFKK